MCPDGVFYRMFNVDHSGGILADAKKVNHDAAEFAHKFEHVLEGMEDFVAAMSQTGCVKTRCHVHKHSRRRAQDKTYSIAAWGAPYQPLVDSQTECTAPGHKLYHVQMQDAISVASGTRLVFFQRQCAEFSERGAVDMAGNVQSHIAKWLKQLFCEMQDGHGGPAYLVKVWILSSSVCLETIYDIGNACLWSV